MESVRTKGLKYVPMLVSVLVLAVGVYAVKYLHSRDRDLEVAGGNSAVFAGGCFWGVERAFEEVEGVLEAVSGYAGGNGPDPTYEDYAEKGHTEVVRVVFDPSVVTYSELLDVYWGEVGAACQLSPKSQRYRTAIFYLDETQRRQAAESKAKLEESGLYIEPVATEIVPLEKFYIAEEHHQDYHRKQQR